MLGKSLLYNPFSSQKVKLFIVLTFLLSYKLFFLTLFVLFVYSLLFKKRKFDRAFTEALQPEILYAPFNGKVISASDNKSNLLLPFYASYGVQMPCQGTVLNYKIHSKKWIKNLKTYSIELDISSELGEIKLLFKCSIPFVLPRIWCRPGDIVAPSAYIGYLLFGGTLSIELKENLNILIKKSDNINRVNTLMYSKG